MTDDLRKDGFIGQRMTYLPGLVKKKVLADARVHDLYITHIGYFPKAKGHFRNRPYGCSQYILIYCTNGEGWIDIKNKRHKLKKNQLFIIRPKTPCRYGASKENPWDNHWIHYTGSNADLYSPPLNKVIDIPQDKDSRIEERLVIFEEMLQNSEDHFNFEKVIYANICLKHFLASVKFLPVYRSIKKNISNNKLEKAINFMKTNIDGRLSLSEIAMACNCSESNISKLFKQTLGTAPIDYFIHLKMQKASKLLLNSKLRIKEISLRLGYDDPYYFSRIFTKHIGQSPASYRKEEQY